MKFSESQVEQITQGVLRQLRLRGVSVHGTDDTGHSFVESSDSVPTGGGSTKPLAASDSILELSDSVITEETLASQPENPGVVRVSPRAIVTPSATDYLRRHQITLHRSAEAGTTLSSGMVISSGTCAALSAAAAMLKWSSIDTTGEFESAQLARQSTAGAVICCDDQPSITAALLNRHSAIRAAVCCPEMNIEDLVQRMTPKVLCIRATGWSVSRLVLMFRSLTAERTVSSNWKELT